jgi:hypothetical protein
MADELDELSKKLFAVGRAERATEEIRSRTLDASTATVNVGRSSRRTTIIGAAALAAGVAGLFWFGEREVGTVTVDRESLPVAPAAKPASKPPEARSHNAERPTAGQPAKLGASARPSPSAERTAASLSDELALLESARSALASGSGERALELLDRYERTLRGTRLRAEASILRVEALAASGRKAEAASLAGEFVKKNPGSPLVDRARAFAGDAQTGPDDHKKDPGRSP